MSEVVTNAAANGSDTTFSLDELTAENARLRETVENLELAIAELKAKQDQLLRTAAAYDNSRRRAERELEDARRYAVERFAKRILPVSDSLRRALEAAKASSGVDALVEGVEMVLKQLDDALESEGVTPVPAVGEPFDPNVHEAVAQHPTADVPENTVVAELQRGYRLNDRLLRASSVLVAVAPSE
jgi:molecular chaperone GrpE